VDPLARATSLLLVEAAMGENGNRCFLFRAVP
jgi:hypothetical protein